MGCASPTSTHTLNQQCQKSLAIAREIKDRRAEGESLGNLGIAYYALGNYLKAIEFHKQRLAITHEIKDRDGERISLNNLGSALSKQQPELAISFYKQAVNVVESIRQDSRNLPRETQELYTASIASTYRNLADLLLTQGRTREAQEILELLKVQESSDYNPSKIQNPKSKIQLKLHPLEQQAIETFDKAIAQNQSLKLQDYESLNQPLKQNRDSWSKTGTQKKVRSEIPKI